MFLFGAGPFAAALIFFTIPIYHWVARALDGDWARGDIRVGPTPVAKAQEKDASAEADADAAAAPVPVDPNTEESDER